MGAPLLPEIDSLVHEPARLRLLVFLAMVSEADFMYILRQTGMSRGNLSVQTSRLEAAGMICSSQRIVASRARTTYALTAAGLRALRVYRLTMEDLLSAIPEDGES